MKPDSSAAAPMPAEPFRGIEPFRFMDRSIFYERKVETRTLTRLTIVYRGVLLYGGQGCGKSSLVNAGLIPAALEEGFMPERLRVQPIPGREIVVERIETGEEDSGEHLPSWLATEAPRDVHLTLPADALHDLIRNRPADDFTPLIIFDQFEELITLFEEQPATKEAFDQAAIAQTAVLEAIHQLLIDEELSVKLLFVFREDYLGKLSKLLNRHPRLRDQSLRLLAPEATALVPIIAGPFEKHPFERPFSPEIVQQLTDAFAARSESGRVRLTEIQIACQTLWRNPDGPAEFATASAIDPAAAIAHLLERYTQEAIASLDKRLRAPAIVLLSRLLTKSGTRNIVEESSLIDQLSQEDHIEEDRSRQALSELVQRIKLVRRETRNDTAFIEIASEFLVPWIESQRTELTARRRERAAMREQAEQQKKSAQRVRLLRRLLVVGCVFFVITAAAAWLAKRAEARAKEALATAEVQSRRAEEARREAAQLADALTAARAAASEQARLAELSLKQSKEARAEADRNVAALEEKIREFEVILQERQKRAALDWDQVQLSSALTSVQQVLDKAEVSQKASKRAESQAASIVQKLTDTLADPGPQAPNPNFPNPTSQPAQGTAP